MQNSQFDKVTDKVTDDPINNTTNNSASNHLANDPINDPINDPVNDPINDPINDRQKVIMQLINDNKFINKELIAEKFNISIETIKRDMRRLKELNKIERIGSRKSGYWQVSNEK